MVACFFERLCFRMVWGLSAASAASPMHSRVIWKDLEKVEKVVLNAVKDIEDSIDHKPIEFFYTEFADSSINFTVRFWVKFTKQTEYLNGMHQAIKAIKKAFNENSITIPFPIRTLDFGINSPGCVLLETKAAS